MSYVLIVLADGLANSPLGFPLGSLLSFLLLDSLLLWGLLLGGLPCYLFDFSLPLGGLFLWRLL